MAKLVSWRQLKEFGFYDFNAPFRVRFLFSCHDVRSCYFEASRDLRGFNRFSSREIRDQDAETRLFDFDLLEQSGSPGNFA
jgi:hypothetical protein